MADAPTLTLEEAQALAARALIANRTSPDNAAATAGALVAAEADGQRGHGLSRVPSYAAQARAGKVDGFAVPQVEPVSDAAVRIDAGHGFAYPALAQAVDVLEAITARTAIGAALVHRSHHFGQAGAHAEALAERGLIGLIYGNSPKGIAPWGGTRPMMGTNPVAFAAPLAGGAPLVIDFSVSKVARGKINAARQAGEAIPEGWALGPDGAPTTDPDAAMAGSMLPIGDAKGAALAMVIEVLAAALTGSHFGFEASSLFDDQGGPPDLGQTLIALDPVRLSGGAFADRMTTFVAALTDEPGVRLPGTRRLEARARARAAGVTVPRALHDALLSLTEGTA